MTLLLERWALSIKLTSIPADLFTLFILKKYSLTNLLIISEKP